MLEEETLKSFIGPPIGGEIIRELGYDEEELREFNTEFRYLYKTKYLMDVKIYPGVKECLERLHNKKFMAVATNKRIDYTLTLMDNLDLSKYFDMIEGSDFENLVKKYDMIKKCLELSGCNQSEVVVVGDTVSDALAAEDCGLDFIGVTYGFGFKKLEDVPFGCVANTVHSLCKLLL